MPPAALEHDTLRENALVAGHVLAGDVLVIELSILDGEDRGIAGAARLEAAELRALQRQVVTQIYNSRRRLETPPQDIFAVGEKSSLRLQWSRPKPSAARAASKARPLPQ